MAAAGNNSAALVIRFKARVVLPPGRDVSRTLIKAARIIELLNCERPHSKGASAMKCQCVVSTCDAKDT
jgi:hypothetical protein